MDYTQRYYLIRDHFSFRKVKQNILTKNSETPKEHISLCVRSTVAVLGEDDGPWMHGTIIEHMKTTVADNKTHSTHMQLVTRKENG